MEYFLARRSIREIINIVNTLDIMFSKPRPKYSFVIIIISILKMKTKTKILRN